MVGDWYRDPTYDAACRLEAQRVRFAVLVNECSYRVAPIFFGDGERCSRRNQSFGRCDFCDLKRGV